MACQAPLSMGFPRQEYWSGLPFPSPIHESESEVAQSGLTLSDPMDCSLPGSSIHGIFQARVLEWGAIGITESHHFWAFFVDRARKYIHTFVFCLVAAVAKSLQSCPTLCDPIDGSSPGSPIPGILQARTPEWVAISSPVHESEK